MAKLLSPTEIEEALENLPAWGLDGKTIRRTFKFDDFIIGIDFVNNVAELAEEMEHHPDIDIRYTRVTLSLSTHSKGGLTALDVQLAERIDALAE